jgi:hypothetical protein
VVKSSECTPTHCGSWLACDGGLPAGLIFLTVLNSKCGSWLACEGGLPADHSLTDVPDQIVGASLLAMMAYQSKVFIAQSTIQTIPTRLSGCPSEVRSLAFDRRYQFSDRDCKPANSR